MKSKHVHIDSSGVFNCLLGSVCNKPDAAEVFNYMLAALKNLIDANDTDSFVGGEWCDAREAVAKAEGKN